MSLQAGRASRGKSKKARRSSLSKALTDQVYRRDKWKCRNPMCGDRNGLHPHHIIFKSHGGADTMENLITLCGWNCHRAIHDGDLKIVTPADANKEVKFIAIDGWRPK
jgi:5-methylcytosine-specific restriction endonuclease McrA